MTDDLKPGLPVSGYRPQSDAAIALVNEFKADEERLLRKLDALGPPKGGMFYIGYDGRHHTQPYDKHSVEASEATLASDPRWVAIARSNFEQGFMALNRAVFQPARVKLPEDEA